MLDYLAEYQYLIKKSQGMMKAWIRSIVRSAGKWTGRLAKWESLFFLSSGRSYRLCFLLLLSYLAVILFILFTSSGIYIWEFDDDSIVMLDGAWRVVCGHRFHTDFYSHYGFLYFSMIALGMKIGGICGRSLVYGPAAVSVVLSFWAWLIAKKRLPAVMSLAFSLLVGTLLIGNYALGVHNFKIASYSMVYNRLGWSLFCLLLLPLVLTPLNSRSLKGPLFEGISAGTILALLFFLKINYFLGGIAILLLIFLRPKNSRWVWMGTAGAFCAIGLLLSFVMRINLAMYIGNIQTLAKLNVSAGLAKTMIGLGVANLEEVALLILIFILLLSPMARRYSGEYMKLILPAFITMSAIIVMSLAICASNFQRAQIPLFAIAGMFLGEDFRRKLIQSGTGGLELSNFRLRFFFSSFLTVYLAGFIFLPDLGSVLYALTTRNLVSHPTISELTRIDAKTMRDIHMLDEAAKLISRGGRFGEIDKAKLADSFRTSLTINDGIKLLKKHATETSRILTMEMSNPFPFAFGLPGPKGSMLAWVYERTFNQSIYPPPESVFQEANLIMVRAANLNPPDPLLKIYLPYIQGHFRVIDSSDIWVLYAR